MSLTVPIPPGKIYQQIKGENGDLVAEFEG
jgi:hypothetical protein